MPREISWKDHIPQILDDLIAGPGTLACGQIAAVFGLGKSQAYELMKVVGAVDRSVSREVLLAYVESRRAKLGVTVTTAEARSLMEHTAGHVTLTDLCRGFRDLPGVTLEPHRLTVEFRDQEDLVQQLFLLARAMNSESETFDRLTRRHA